MDLRRIGCAALLGYLSAIAAEETERKSVFADFESPYYVFRYRAGPGWRDGVPPLEQDLAGHFAYMSELERTGQLLLGGPLDRTGGSDMLGVLEATSLSEAESLLLRDPAVVAGVVEIASVDRWIAGAGTGCLDPSRVRRTRDEMAD